MMGWSRQLKRKGQSVRQARFTLDLTTISPNVTIRHEPRARRYGLRVVQSTGDVVLTVPPNGNQDDALAFLSRQEDWLVKRLTVLPKAVPFVEGSVIPLRGVEHQLIRSGTLRGRVSLREPDDADGLPVIVIPGEVDHMSRRLSEWLKQEARGELQAACARYTALIGKSHGRITVRDTRSRWGSCSTSGGLSFSWRLIMAPPRILDYVAAHEVAHLEHMNHSAAFWDCLGEIYDDVVGAEAWLKKHGMDLHRYGRSA